MSAVPPPSAAWPALLAARSHLRAQNEDLALARVAGEWHCRAADAELGDAEAVIFIAIGGAIPMAAARLPKPCSVFVPGKGTDAAHWLHPSERPIDAGTLEFCRLYLPVLVGSALAWRAQRVFVSAHLAQTLDGRIACASGHSQWIGNQANLVHAHRMRALHDAVLVGGRTVDRDDPQLTVRHVNGPQPRRVVLSGSGRVVRGDHKVLRDAGCLVLTHAVVQARHGNVEIARLPDEGGHLAADTACAALWQRGLRSVYVEGGGATVSTFLQARRIDLLHLHLAPIVLGSGVAAFSLPEVDRIADGTRFGMSHFAFDGHVLFECRPDPGIAAS
jgi:diaminohydroxyphosphoribosylaminopyrimidine deaminase / 5-amino-6-(5-phosphoribosylamino)uracil reductase